MTQLLEQDFASVPPTENVSISTAPLRTELDNPQPQLLNLSVHRFEDRPEIERVSLADTPREKIAESLAHEQEAVQIPSIQMLERSKSGIRLYNKDIQDYSSIEIGREGENIACRYLQHRGYTILAQNWRIRDAEADIICRIDQPVMHDDGAPGTVILLEVKTRNAIHYPTVIPEIAVDYYKQRKYQNIALMYYALHPEIQIIRFDVIAINLTSNSNAKLRHLMGAFTWDE